MSETTKREQCGNDGEGDRPSAPRSGIAARQALPGPEGGHHHAAGVYRDCLEALVRSILETGNFLGIKTVAGFVEDVETLSKLGEMGVDCVQGALIGEPQPLARLG
jgi:hypothetical protein